MTLESADLLALIEKTDGPVVLDVKTCPGLSETSIVPLAVTHAHLSFDDFVGRVLDAESVRVRVVPTQTRHGAAWWRTPADALAGH